MTENLPNGWRLIPLKHCAREPIRNGIGAPAEEDREDWPRYIRITDISGSRALRPDTFKSLSPLEARKAPVVLGDLLLAAVGATYGKSYLHSRDIGPACYAGYLVKVSPASDVEGRFLAYWTESEHYWHQVRSSVIQSTIQNFSAGKYRQLLVPLPPTEEQRAIADYLDEKTAIIDGLMAKRERHIELLEEELQAVIARTVTRGLNAAAVYCDSGFPSIRAVPRHWRVAELRRAWDVVDCKHRTPTYVEEGYPLVSTTEVKPGRLDLRQTTRFVGADDFADMTEGPRRPKRGDIIYSRNASLGSAAYVDTDEPFCMGQDVVLITSTHQDQLFLSYGLNSRVVGAQAERMSIGSTFNRINVSQIRSFIVPIPPREEQIAIAAHLDLVSARTAKTVSRIREQIEKLREYRQTLISAAVMGQTPVHQEVPA